MAGTQGDVLWSSDHAHGSFVAFLAILWPVQGFIAAQRRYTKGERSDGCVSPVWLLPPTSLQFHFTPLRNWREKGEPKLAALLASVSVEMNWAATPISSSLKRQRSQTPRSAANFVSRGGKKVAKRKAKTSSWRKLGKASYRSQLHRSQGGMCVGCFNFYDVHQLKRVLKAGEKDWYELRCRRCV